jgi:AraC-like DNA-binding protein
MAQKLEFIRQRLNLRGMDAVTGLLDGPRARGAYLTRSILSRPWSLRIEDQAPLSLMVLLRGTACLVRDGQPPTTVRPGDVAIARGPESYTVADDATTSPLWVIHPDQRSTTISGEEIGRTMDLGVRTWGNDPEGSTVILSGVYLLDSEVSQRLLATLPSQLVVPVGESTSPIIELLAAEMVKEEPGQESVLDRLLDLLLITTLRAWFSRPEAQAPGWYLANADEVVGPALRMIYEDPAHPWTVASLAKRAGASRATLARRFTELVGESPMKFLTEWRLALAADLLRDPQKTIAAVAAEVGYATPYALSTAFKRAHGISPKDYRSSHASAAGVNTLSP